MTISPLPAIQLASAADLDHTVTAHMSAFPSFFLSFLGPRFLKEFYRGLVDAQNGALLIAVDETGVVGFVGGVTDERAFFRWLLESRRHVFVKEAVRAAIRHPSAIPRLWRARRRDEASFQSATKATLLTLGVSPLYRRQGLGEALVAEFDRAVGSVGVTEYSLTTDTEGNDRAKAFYTSIGMISTATRVTPEGRMMTEYLRRVPDSTFDDTSSPITPYGSARVAFLCQWFPPEPGVPEISFGLAKGLQDIGHNVHVVTGMPNYPTGRVQTGYSATRVMREVVRGVPSLRTPLFPSHDSSTIGRIANYTSFAVSSGFFGRNYLRTSDINFVISSPATVDATAAVFRKLHGRPYVLSIQDLWPESIYATGFLESGLARLLSERALRACCDATMRHAAAVLVITPSMKSAVVARGVPADRVHVLYNWVDESTLRPAPLNSGLRDRLGLAEEDMVFLYSGNIGSAQNLGVWIQAFLSGDMPLNAHLAIQGDGHLRADFERRAAGSRHVHFLPQQPSLSNAVTLMHGADAMVVSLSDHKLSSYTMPSKIPSSLALGRAVVATVPGDAAQVLSDSGAGIVARPGDADFVREVICRAVAEGRPALAQRGRLAREYYEATMSREVGLRVLREVIESVLAGGGR